jgi:hypothetical protein
MKHNKDIITASFSQTDFSSLMQQRVYRVLLICSQYDAFILEEDGRIDDQLFKEYTALHFNFPPVVLKTHNLHDAFEVLSKEKIDLVITMLHGDEEEPFKDCDKIRKKYHHVPIVVLTPFSRRITSAMKSASDSFDYIFSWLGNADLLLAIIKIIEDRNNIANDMEAGVQAILFADDSVRYTSQVLPALYKIIFKQALDAAKQEGLNENQTTIRKRARPKILLARNYAEAMNIYKKYGKNLIGIMSDVELSDDVEGSTEGLKLCGYIKRDNPSLPVILHSSDTKYEKNSKNLVAGFINKQSKTLLKDIENSVTYSFGFGDFVFRKPDDSTYIAHASDLYDFQKHIRSVPDESFSFHAKRNDFSRWFNTRGLFSIARLFKQFSNDDFSSIAEMKDFVYQAIDLYRKGISSALIAEFNASHIDPKILFYRLGEGSIGGKARGLSFLNHLIATYGLTNKYHNVNVAIPRTLFISSDYFDEFIDINKLTDLVQNPSVKDEEIMKRFVSAQLPDKMIWNLRMYLNTVTRPLAIRSSSKLEDSYYQPFAGVYKTYMIPNLQDQEKFLSDVADAVKAVYSSVFLKESRSYIEAISTIIDVEKMAVVIQEVSGNAYDSYFYPMASGVMRSVNYYPVEPENPADGIVNIAVGLGKYVVENEPSLRFCPVYPKKILQHYSTDTILKESQKTFLALHQNTQDFVPDLDGFSNIVRMKISDAAPEILSQTSSSYEMENQNITNNPFSTGKKIVTFSNLLHNNDIPLADVICEVLRVSCIEMNSQVEIEFSIEINPADNKKLILHLLQIRPIANVFSNQEIDTDLYEDCFIKSDKALGNGFFKGVNDIIYIKPESFRPEKSQIIAGELEKFNEELRKSGKNYVLIGTGRWGSSDPWLGIPVKWAQISEAIVIVEMGMDKHPVEPSQGTHFFQNLISIQAGYMVVDSHQKNDIMDFSVLDRMPAVNETEYIRRVRFDNPLKIIINGKKNKGVIAKPPII